jgi:arylsulfatase A-like enzyme
MFAYWKNPVLHRALDITSRNTGPPNIILISVDTLRADHLKCYGYHRETSPQMNNLAAEGVLFERPYSSTSWTLPAHLSLLTSLDNRNHGVRKATPFLDPSIVTLADLLRTNGYFTHAITGGALVSQRYGFSKGFDSYREFKRSRLFPDMAKTQSSHVQQWLKINKDKKFFLFLHTYQPHAPYTSPSPYNTAFLSENMPWEEGDIEPILFGKGQTHNIPFNKLSRLELENIVALYDGEIKYTDEILIRPLVQKLKDLGLYQNTMIILTSDHGEEFFDHEAWLHGHTLYNELIHIPLIFKFPHSKFTNLRIEDDVRIVDIMPTILDELGIDHTGYGFDGRSLIPKLLGRETERQTVIADLEALENTHRLPTRIAFTWKGYKLILNNDYGNPPEQYLPSPPPIAQVELYDKTNDPTEIHNIAEENEAIVKEIIEKIYTIYESSAKAHRRKRKVIDKALEETMRALGYSR